MTVYELIAAHRKCPRDDEVQMMIPTNGGSIGFEIKRVYVEQTSLDSSQTVVTLTPLPDDNPIPLFERRVVYP